MASHPVQPMPRYTPDGGPWVRHSVVEVASFWVAATVAWRLRRLPLDGLSSVPCIQKVDRSPRG
jgi:hypothetical protein